MALGECVVKINEVTEGILDKLGARIKGAAQGIQKSYNARQQANAIQQRQATAQKKVQQKAALNDPKAKDAILDQIVDNIVRNPKEREKFDKMLELLSQQGHNQKGVINTNDIGSTVAKIYPDPNIKPAMIDFVSQRLVSRGFKVNNQRVAQRNAPTGPATDIKDTLEPDTQCRFANPEFPGTQIIVRNSGWYLDRLPPELRGKVPVDKATRLYPILQPARIRKYNLYYNQAAEALKVKEEPATML